MAENDVLKVLLTEYNALRSELNRIFDRELQIFSIIISALGVIYGIIFSQGAYDLILFIPILIIPLALKFKYGTECVTKIGKYLKDKTEEQIHASIKQEDLIKQSIEWKGWQHYHDKLPDKDIIIKKYDMLSKLLLFVLIPALVSIFYSLSIIFSMHYKEFLSKFLKNTDTNSIVTKLPELTQLNINTHYIFLISYIGFIIYFLVVFYKGEPRGFISVFRGKNMIKKGSYYKLGKNPGIPIQIVDETENGYIISIFQRVNTELKINKEPIENMSKKGELEEISKDKAEQIAMVWKI